MIGLFDSGSGGLSVMKAMRERVPNVNIVYFGDIKHAPYGLRSQDELPDLATHGMRTLRMFGAQEIVSACPIVAPSIYQESAVGASVIDLSRPVAHRLRAYQGGRVLLLSTPATAASRVFETAFGSMVILDHLPIHDLEGAIEFGSHDGAVRDIVRKALSLRWGQSYDYLFLGCSHFPLVRHVIEEEARAVFGNISIIDPAEIAAEEAVRSFDMSGTGSTYFKLSQDSEHFRRRVGELFPSLEPDFRIL